MEASFRSIVGSHENWRHWASSLSCSSFSFVHINSGLYFGQNVPFTQHLRKPGPLEAFAMDYSHVFSVFYLFVTFLASRLLACYSFLYECAFASYTFLISVGVNLT